MKARITGNNSYYWKQYTWFVWARNGALQGNYLSFWKAVLVAGRLNGWKPKQVAP